MMGYLNTTTHFLHLELVKIEWIFITLKRKRTTNFLLPNVKWEKFGRFSSRLHARRERNYNVEVRDVPITRLFSPNYLFYWYVIHKLFLAIFRLSPKYKNQTWSTYFRCLLNKSSNDLTSNRERFSKVIILAQI